jgi:hypothetical protein
MKALCIERHSLTRYLLWIEDGGYYRKIIVQEGDEPEELTSVPTSKYWNYDHFVGVMGKFNPNYVFIDPVDLPSLDFDVIGEIASKLDMA